VEEGLQWWYRQKIEQLESEASLIREQLLQESFAMRRSLELSLMRSDRATNSCHQKYLKQLESFHQKLKDLSDRLSPPYINEGLPWALQYLIKKWQEEFINCQFDLQLPTSWHQKDRDIEYIIVNFIEELLELKLKNSLASYKIFLELKQNRANNIEIIFLTKECETKTEDKKKRQKYIQESFQLLTSGVCKIEKQQDRQIWYFIW
jgi:hypothetical protein